MAGKTDTKDFTKLLNELIEDYSNNPRKGKENAILTVAKLCPLYINGDGYLITVEIWKNNKFNNYLPVYTKPEMACGNYKIKGMLDIVNTIKCFNISDNDDYEIDGIIINPKDLGIAFNIEELTSFNYVNTKKYLEMISWFDPRPLVRIDKAVNDYLSNFNNGIIPIDDIETDYRRIELEAKPGELIVVGGRPGMGKTQLAISAMLNEVENNNGSVIYFNAEWPNIKIAEKVINEITHIGNVLDYISNEEYSRMYKCLEMLKNKEAYIQDSICFNIDDIKETLKNNQQIKPTMIIIDYIQEIGVGENSLVPMNTKKAMMSLKEIAKDTNAKVIILSELNRSLENRCDKHPIMSDIRVSSQIGEMADKVYMIYRDDYYSDDYENYNNKIEITCIKPESETKIYNFNNNLGYIS